MKVGKLIGRGILALLALILVLLVTLQIVLRPKVLTSLVNRFAAEYVEGDLSFRQVRAHVIKTFPYLNLEAEDFALTYPHDRYAVYDTLYPDNGRRFSLMRAGRGTEVDTLASFRNLSLSFNYVDFLKGNTIHIHKAELVHPRIFAHYYDTTAANWDILPIADKDTTKEKKPFPRLILNRISLSQRPFIVFTNPADTIHALFTLRRLEMDGKVDTRHLDKMKTQLAIDSVFVSGRLPADTLAFRLERLRAQALERHLDLDLNASASLATNDFGRLRVPVALSVDGDLPKRADKALELVLNSLGLQVSAIDLQGKGRLVHKDGWDLDVQAAIQDCPIGEVMRQYQENIPALKKIQTNAHLSLDAKVKGQYKEGVWPDIDARLQVPQSTVDYEGLGRKGRVALDMTVKTDSLKRLNAAVKRLFVDIVGARVDASASAKDVLGQDPLLALDGTVNARVDSLTRAFLQDKGISGTGRIQANLHGKARMSQLDMVHIGAADINCKLTGSDLWVQDLPDTLDASIPKLELELETKGNTIDRNIRQGARVLALKAVADTLDVLVKDMTVQGGKVKLLMQNSADILKGGKELTPLMGLLKVGVLRLMADGGTRVSLRDNTEAFRISPATSELPVPKLTLHSNSSRLRIRAQENFFSLHDFKFDVSASRHQRRQINQERRNHILDSLQRVYPGVPRDSLFRKARLSRQLRESLDEFASKDIKLDMSSGFQQYAREWDVFGNVDLGSGRVFMPAFPLATRVSVLKGTVDNDAVNIRDLTVQAGASDLSAKAKLTGLRRALTGRGKPHFKLNADFTSNYFDVGEFLRGISYSAHYVPPTGLEQASDEAVLAAVEDAELPDKIDSPLLVLPANLDADVSLEANGIRFDSLMVTWAAADLAMRDRTLQITNALAASNMGDLFFEGFYATHSKEDVKAGFDLSAVDITAQKVISLFPSVDQMMPLLNSFSGKLDCEVAATTAIDTSMNLILPSLNGLLRFSGRNLVLKDSKEFTKVAKLLMFKNNQQAVVDNMSVTGIVRDNQLEVFPFILDVDRYLLAASGVQGLDERFNYHVSVIRSPLLIKFGLNAWGSDFKHIRYGLGRAKYKNANVPVFTKQLDTAQYSLVAAIHNVFELGVERALAENQSRAGSFVPLSEITDQPLDTLANEAVRDSLQRVGDTMDNIVDRVVSRREALREEVLRQQEAIAVRNESAADLPKKKKNGK
ncbi:MAG: hypothetical protein J5669_03550 [Bacteroidales bacterium]|nr:hypothetical protein [Bacteroidales bacterium]